MKLFCTRIMAWLLPRRCCLKVCSQTTRGPFLSSIVRAWSSGPLTAYMPEAVSFPGSRNHQGLYRMSVEQVDTFWGTLGRNRLTWISPFHSVQDCNLEQGRVAWFLGGQLNVAGKLEAITPSLSSGLLGNLPDPCLLGWILFTVSEML